MRAPGFAVPAHYLRIVADQARIMGADIPAWLARCGLGEAALADPGRLLEFEAFRALVLGAVEATREPALGLFVGRRLTATTHGMLGYAVLSSGSIRQALEVFERFTRLRLSAIAVTTEVTRGEVRVRIAEAHPLGDVQRPVLEAVAMAVKNALDAISMGAFRISAVTFPFPAPAYADLARELFGCAPRYGERWAGFTLAEEVLDVPLRMADPEAFREAARICQRDLDRLAANESLAGRVRRILLDPQGGLPSLPVTARLLHLTPRTLHRRLTEEGTSFRAILDDVRRGLAVEHLRSGKLGVEEIAFTLGYTDAANFRRAFKRWESVSPAEFRARHAQG